MSAWEQAMPCWFARASMRPNRNEFTTLFRMGQVWETCQFFVSCTKTRSPMSESPFPLVVFSYFVFVNRAKARPNPPRSWSRRTVNWFCVWGSVRTAGSCPAAR